MDSKIPLDPKVKINKSPKENFRPCCAMVVYDPKNGKTLNARSVNDYDKPYQYPQGGINENESPSETVLRELAEETAISKELVTVEVCVPTWLYYKFPDDKNPYKNDGQIQAWFLLRLKENCNLDLDEQINLAKDKEFKFLRWCDPQEALNDIVPFKQKVYLHALNYFAKTKMQEYPNWQDLII